jgi:hypothetical protein
LSTGHLRRSPRDEVDGETLARVAPWLAAAVEPGQAMPLPVSALARYTALAAVLDGSLLVTISGPPQAGGPMRGTAPPLVTLGVAQRSRHGAALWPLLTGPHMPPAKPGVVQPAAPWCGVVLWPTIMLHPNAMEWIGDLERCIAWAWIERRAPAPESQGDCDGRGGDQDGDRRGG